MEGDAGEGEWREVLARFPHGDGEEDVVSGASDVGKVVLLDVVDRSIELLNGEAVVAVGSLVEGGEFVDIGGI